LAAKQGKSLLSTYAPTLEAQNVALWLSASVIDLPADNLVSADVADTFQIRIARADSTIRIGGLQEDLVAAQAQAGGRAFNDSAVVMCLDECSLSFWGSKGFVGGAGWRDPNRPQKDDGNGVPPPSSPRALAAAQGDLTRSPNTIWETNSFLGGLIDGDRGLAQLADLGRGSGMGGAGVDVFQARSHVLQRSNDGDVTIDQAYLLDSPFSYLDESERRARPTP
jgi:hypothetical protein